MFDIASLIKDNLILFIILIIILVTWDVIWKVIAAWKAARNSQKTWFVVILILNTLGILPILYILFFQKKKRR